MGQLILLYITTLDFYTLNTLNQVKLIIDVEYILLYISIELNQEHFTSMLTFLISIGYVRTVQ